MSGWGALFLIVRRSLRQHALSTAVTVLSVGLASGLVMAVFAVTEQTRSAFVGGPVGFDAVVGARGSQLQLVLNTVFHLETSPGNIPWSLYKTLEEDPRVEVAIPYAVGDNYRGFRIVGTTPEIFTRFEYQKGKRFEFEGEHHAPFDPLRMEAVIGSTVAQRTGLRYGDTFHPYHGLDYHEDAKHPQIYTVVGVVEPTNSPSDRVIWIPIEGVFRMEGHELRGAGGSYTPKPGEMIPDEHKEVSAVMLKLGNPRYGWRLHELLNLRGKEATIAWPIGRVMAQLFEKMGWIHRVLELVSYLVVVVAGGSILASIYNTMNERRREFAILRALGARRGTVFSAIVLEAATIAGLGSAVGLLCYAGILLGAATVIRGQTGVVLDLAAWHPVLVWCPAGMIGVGAMSGLLPALKAYSTDVAHYLTPR